MATYSKTYATLLTLQEVAASTVLISSAVDVATKMGGAFYVRFGRLADTAAGAGVNIRLEASHASSGDNSWFPFAQFTTNFAAVVSEAVSGTVASGQKVITVASTTGLTAGDIIYIDNGTPANSEFCRIKSIVSNTSVTVEDNLVAAATGLTFWDGAEIYPPVSLPPGVARIRAVIDGALFTQAFAIEIRYTTIDGIA